MPLFKVTQISDGDTFVVPPAWKWNAQSGNRLRPAGYETPEIGSVEAAASISRFGQITLHQQVELSSGYRVDYGVCEVVFAGRNLKDYFPRFRT